MPPNIAMNRRKGKGVTFPSLLVEWGMAPLNPNTRANIVP